MKDKTEQIIKAAVKIFIKKGFLQATTQEIAKEANVAEITLYRKFTTKQNLFETVIKKVLEKKIHMKIDTYKELTTEEFLNNILDDRLDTLTRNKELIKMLLSESLTGHVPDDLQFPTLIFNSLKAGIQSHFDKYNIQSDPELLTQQIVGILLSHVIFGYRSPYYQLPKEEKNKILNYYLRSLQVNL